MNLPRASIQYDAANEAQARGIQEREDKRNLKVGSVFDKILMRDTVTGTVVTLTVASGSLVIT